MSGWHAADPCWWLRSGQCSPLQATVGGPPALTADAAIPLKVLVLARSCLMYPKNVSLRKALEENEGLSN